MITRHAEKTALLTVENAAGSWPVIARGSADPQEACDRLRDEGTAPAAVDEQQPATRRRPAGQAPATASAGGGIASGSSATT